ncbi:hypothetical protein M9H77_14203 [Catharanthus roseus]|uniref:Uncharacterized protein n=1 Tax=Catharanthus roseus TaxID=4058 RepID=A0ACC0BMM5_CATRO|nr:hypothetical protein M9H77_14203 [Catharanthus roseus]
MFAFVLKSPEPHPGESTKPCFLIFANITGLHVVNWRMGIFAENIQDLTLTCWPDIWPFCCKHIRKPHSDQSYSSGYDLAFRSVRGLHCTWLVPSMRASSDGVDDLDSGEWIHLKRGIVPWRTWPNHSTWTPHHALWWDGRLVESQEGLETKVGPRADLVGAPRVCSLF